MVSAVGTLGACYVVREEDRFYYKDASVLLLRPKADLDPQFVRYAFLSKELLSQVEAGEGATVGTFTIERARKATIPFPPLDEQKRIVAALDQAFAALNRGRANAEANLEAAERLRQDALDASFSTIAAQSASVELQEAVHPDCGLSYGIVQPGDEVDGGLPIVRPVDLTQREIGLAGLKRIDPAAARGYSRTTLQGGEVLLCVRGSTGIVSVASQELAGANVTRGIVPIRFDPARVLRDFAYFQFRSSLVSNQIAGKTYGAALMQINIKDLRALRFLVPDLETQRDIVRKSEAVLADTQALCRSYQAQLSDIADLRQSLLQAAFSGQLL
nr:restriction endonuclease subunit S [Chiayiivirga flava]